MKQFRFFISSFVVFIILGLFLVTSEVQSQVINADLNGDGKVDIQDYGVFVANAGKTGTTGDTNGDQSVDIIDQREVVKRFGQTTSPDGGSAIDPRIVLSSVQGAPGNIVKVRLSVYYDTNYKISSLMTTVNSPLPLSNISYLDACTPIWIKCLWTSTYTSITGGSTAFPADHLLSLWGSPPTVHNDFIDYIYQIPTNATIGTVYPITHYNVTIYNRNSDGSYTNVTSEFQVIAGSVTVTNPGVPTPTNTPTSVPPTATPKPPTPTPVPPTATPTTPPAAGFTNGIVYRPTDSGLYALVSGKIRVLNQSTGAVLGTMTSLGFCPTTGVSANGLYCFNNLPTGVKLKFQACGSFNNGSVTTKYYGYRENITLPYSYPANVYTDTEANAGVCPF